MRGGKRKRGWGVGGGGKNLIGEKYPQMLLCSTCKIWLLMQQLHVSCDSDPDLQGGGGGGGVDKVELSTAQPVPIIMIIEMN